MSTQNQPNFWWYLFRKNRKQLFTYDRMSISNLGAVVVLFLVKGKPSCSTVHTFWVLGNPNRKTVEQSRLWVALASANWLYQDKLTNCRPKLWDNKNSLFGMLNKFTVIWNLSKKLTLTWNISYGSTYSSSILNVEWLLLRKERLNIGFISNERDSSC